MSDTPETDEQINGKPCTRFEVYGGDSLRDALVPSEFARKLERERDEARSELERERMRLAACGVLAGCNTQDSLSKNLSMHPDYMSSSAQCVANAMCREIAIRARAERAEKERDEVRKALQSVMDRNPKAGYWERPETVARFEADMARAREVLEETQPTQTTNQPQISTKLAL